MESRPTVRINGKRFAQCASEANARNWIHCLERAYQEIMLTGKSIDIIAGAAIKKRVKSHERFHATIDYKDWRGI